MLIIHPAQLMKLVRISGYSKDPALPRLWDFIPIEDSHMFTESFTQISLTNINMLLSSYLMLA